MPFTEENEKQLIEEGWTVVRGVLDEQEAKKSVDGLWDALCSVSPKLDRNDPTTWPSNWPDNIHGIVQFLGLSHCQALWDVRQNPKVVQVYVDLYRRLWGLDLTATDLSCSFDAFCFQKENVLPYRNAPWVHTDQAPSVPGIKSPWESPVRPGLKSVQGVMNLMKSGPTDGGLWLYPKSHLVHQRFFEKNRLVGKAEDDWFTFKEHAEYLRQLETDATPYLPKHLVPEDGSPVVFEPVKVCAEPGDLMLFDSRVHHQAVWPDGKAPSQSQARLRRAVAYVCMSPKSWQTESSKRLRRESLALFKTTSHCPHKPKLFQDTARYSNGNCSHYVVPPVLTELGKSLAGLGKDEAWPKTAHRMVRGKLLPVGLNEELREKRDQKRLRDVAIKANKRTKTSPPPAPKSPKPEKKPPLWPTIVKRKRVSQ
jgi:hypothetical protein